MARYTIILYCDNGDEQYEEPQDIYAKSDDEAREKMLDMWLNQLHYFPAAETAILKTERGDNLAFYGFWWIK